MVSIQKEKEVPLYKFTNIDVRSIIKEVKEELEDHLTAINENTNEIQHHYEKQQIDDIEYKTTNAYKNMILKKEQWLKNKWEEVVYLIEEKKYDKYTKKIDSSNINKIEIIKTDSPIDSMTIFQKWIYLIFNKDIK